jgi:hypothetical protein
MSPVYQRATAKLPQSSFDSFKINQLATNSTIDMETETKVVLHPLNGGRDAAVVLLA